MFPKILKKSVVDLILESFLKMVHDGIFLPGERLPSERDLAEKLNVSRTSIREALKALSFVDVVTILPGNGTFLTDDTELIEKIRAKYSSSITSKGITYRQAYEVRRIVEAEMCALSAQRANHEDIFAIKMNVDEMEKALQKNDMTRFHSIDMEFHLIIGKSTHNPLLADISSYYLDKLTENMPTLEQAKLVLAQHKAIYLAIKSKDIQGAREYAEEHLKQVRKDLDLSSLLITQKDEK
ncbi:FadR/GntR family transcriptional regulator [Murdochiella vaginalis]|uniref:FadR/GntR family transcriptional regulator n=1 Tax=Murdochiella vaginalis TaxID=1852373 RepID=UPI0008FDA97A|nr:FadR/GntR family transcriptional regulator [Murdochiella vaginalis]